VTVIASHRRAADHARSDAGLHVSQAACRDCVGV